MDSVHVCSECGKEYNIGDKDADISCCSFDCWQKINCKTPIIYHVDDPILIFQ